MQSTCFLIGESALLIECATILQEQGFQIKGLLSNDVNVRNFAQTDHLPCLPVDQTLPQILSLEPFDYLFSIVNETVLPGYLLGLPTKLAINYHDGPLPAYAGVNATFWALVNQEETHGVTWHVMNKGIDKGEILVQQHFTIAPDETSISLNIKCYQAALESFRQLVQRLVIGYVSGQNQDLARRSYFSRSKRPDTIIDWNQTAFEIERLFRALDFGFHSNPFGLPTLKLKDTWLAVTKLRAIASSPPGREHRGLPGFIQHITDGQLRVYTGEGIVAIESLRLLTGEILSAAEAVAEFGLREGDQLAAPDPALRHFISQQCGQLARHESYWLKKITSFSATSQSALALQPPPPTQQRRWQTVSVPVTDLPGPLASEVPVTTWWCSSFLVLLSRISNSQRVGVYVQTDASRRAATSSEGFFSQWLPLEISFSPGSQALQAALQVSQELTQAAAQGTYATDLPLRNAKGSRAPLTAAPFDPSFAVCFAGTEAPLLEDTCRHLVLVLHDDGPCQFWFNPASWRWAEVSRLVQHWKTLLESISQSPALPLSGLNLVPSAERHRLHHTWNATGVPYPHQKLIHQLVEQQAQQHPQRVAVADGKDSLTYQQLNQLANQLAGYLQKSGVKPETLVGICMNRSSRLVMGLLAILKAGGAYVPLDGNHPDARLRFLVEETGLQLVITERQWASRFPNVAHLIILDEADLLAGESTENLSVPARADGLAYVIFTSGSTGKPKGVCVPHRGVVRLVKGANYARLDDRVIMLGLAPVAFDASTFEIWGSLANGGQLVLVPASHPSLGEIKQIIRSWQVNTLFITTALFNVLVDEGTADLASLRQLLTGGEAASKLHLQRACEQLPACRIVNVYGPTENTTFSSFYEVTAQSLEASTATSVPIGAPVSNTQLYVLDAHRSLLPVGVPGELYVAGDGLAREYLHHPALTEEKFIRHSLGTAGSVRLYRTGDWVRRLPDGNLEFMGRIDGQIKVRGFRIEPGEIEHRLCQHSSVKEAFVTAWQASSPEKKLVAYLVLRPGSGLDALALRQFVQSELPGYMVPEAWITLPALPLNHNGKVDRAALPPPPTGPARTDESGLTPTEREIAAWWKELLNASAAKQDHFFAQGGNSLLAMQLLSRIRSRFGIPLSMQDLFEHPTLEQLGTRIDGAGFGAAAPSALRLRAGTWANRARVPLSAAQQRLWVLHQLHDLGGTYNVPVVLHLTGLLHLEALVYSLETLVARHAVLRTTFGYGHGQPRQQIASTVPVTLPVFTAELARGSNTPETLTGLLEAEAWRPFDLAQDRPWRAQLLQLSQEAHVLVLVFHHMVVDGWSLRVLAGEISTLYTSRVKGLPAALPPLPVQYPDYVQWQADQNQSGAWQSQLGYWKQHLAGVPPLLQLNLSRPRPANLTFAGDVHTFPLPAATADQLSQLGQTCRATPFMTWLSVFAVWLHQYSSREDLVVGTPIAGRNQRELESLLGFFVNTLVLRLRLPSRFTFRQVVDTVVETATQAYAHADLPFDQLVAELNPKRDSSYAPLVQIVFDLQEESVNWWQLSGLNVGPVRIRERTAKFDLHLSICRGQHGWESRFAYNSALFEAGTVARAAAHFVQLARQVVQSPDLPLDQFNPPERTKGVPADTASQEQLAELPLTPAVRADAVEQDNALGGAARNAMLANLWKKILKVDSIGPDEDFFSLGGNSLLAIQLIAELQRQTGYSLPVASLFAHSTVQEFSRYLLQFDACRVWESLVAVKPEGTRKAFFCVHPVSGGVDFIYKLAAHLPAQQPVYGLQARGLNGMDAPRESLEEMAAHYVQLIVKQQPEGPYHLGGYSLGGIIAYEMAIQLRQMGKDVGVLAVFDSYPYKPSERHYLGMPLKYVLLGSWHFLRTTLCFPWANWQQLATKTPVALRYFFTVLRHHLNGKQKAAPPQGTCQPASLAPAEQLVTAGVKAYNTYSFKPYPGKLVFYRATGGAAGPTRYIKNFDFGWNKFALGGVAVHELASDHNALFKTPEHIAFIATTLYTHLTKQEELSVRAERVPVVDESYRH